MSLIKEIENMMIDVNSSINFRLINLGGVSQYIEGIKSVVSLDETEMRFQLKKQLLIIKGENLKVKYLDKNTSIVTGQIKVVELQWNSN